MPEPQTTTNRLINESSPYLHNTPTTPSTGTPGATKHSKKPSKKTNPSYFPAAILPAIGGTSAKDTISKIVVIN